MTFDRISDTRASLTVSGKLDPVAAEVGYKHILVVDNPFATAPSDATNFSNSMLSSTLRDGTIPFTYAYAVSGAMNFNSNALPDLYFGSSSGGLLAGLDFTGTMEFTLRDGITFAPNGSRGDIYWGVFDTAVKAGTWQMGVTPASSNVPEPASAALLLAGVAALALTRRRKA
jgi:hypothetical protein